MREIIAADTHNRDKLYPHVLIFTLTSWDTDKGDNDVYAVHSCSDLSGIPFILIG